MQMVKIEQRKWLGSCRTVVVNAIKMHMLLPENLFFNGVGIIWYLKVNKKRIRNSDE